MKSHSSTSNSEESFVVGKLPWALFIAIGLLVLVEVWVHRQDPRSIIPHENTGRTAYSAVRHYLNATGPAQISFLGSSRGREAIVVPEVRDRIKDMIGKRVRVANYSSPAASGDEIEKIVRLMLRQDKKPKLLMYGVSPLQLSKLALSTTHSEELWYLDDWWREKRKTRRNIFGVIPDYQYNMLPDIIRNEIGKRYLTFEYRHKATLMFREFMSERRQAPCPVAGQLSYKQKRKPDKSLAARPIPEKRVKNYLSKRMVKDKYPLSSKQVEHIRTAIHLCKDAGIDFMMYELPLAQILQDTMPAETLPQFKSMIETLATEEDVQFIRLADIDAEFTDEHFREQSHMNLPGAQLFSSLLTERVIVPYLEEENKRRLSASANGSKSKETRN